MRKAFAIALLCLLAACANVQPARDKIADTEQQASQDAAALQAFAVADIQNALDIAQRHDDVLAVQCFTALGEFVAGQDVTIAPAKGAVTAYEKARVVRLKVQRGLPDAVRTWCGALVNDSRQTLFSIAARLGLNIPGL